MTAPNSFKGFGIPNPIKIVPIRRADEAEFDRVLAAYQRQGLSTERALSHLSISIVFHMLEEAGFKPGEDFHYDSSAGAGALSPAAVAHLAKENPEGIRETLAKHRIPGPCDIAPEETGRGEGGEMMLSYVAVAKLLTANLSGLDPNADPEIASASAIDMMRSDGLPEADAIELVSNAKANEDGARLRLVQRLGPALRRQWHKKD